MATEPSPHVAADEILAAIGRLYPATSSFWQHPVQDYAHYLYDYAPAEVAPAARQQALQYLVTAIGRACLRSGLNDADTALVRNEFAANPVLQTGPHLLLAIDPEAHFTHIFSVLGLRSHGRSAYVSYAVSTVNMVEKGRKGPGWINLGDEAISLFGLSRNQMLQLTMLAGPGLYRFNLTTNMSSLGVSLRPLRHLLPQHDFERPAHAIKAANQILWPVLFGADIKLVQIDDEDIADLVVDHLTDGGWLGEQLFGEGGFAEFVLAEIDSLASGAWGGWLSRSTDFFWLYDGNRRCPLKLIDGMLTNAVTGERAVPFEQNEICRWLRERRLIPNLVLMFLVSAILPGVRALGGSRHPIYYPLMRYVVVQALRKSGGNARVCEAVAADRHPAGWGHRVIEAGSDALYHFLGARNDLLQGLPAHLGRRRLIDACGAMESFTGDPLWQVFAPKVIDGRVRSEDPQWSFS